MTAPCGVCGGPRVGLFIGWPGLRSDRPAPLRDARLPICGMPGCHARAVARMIVKAGPGAIFPWHLAGLGRDQRALAETFLAELTGAAPAPRPPSPPPATRARKHHQPSLI